MRLDDSGAISAQSWSARGVAFKIDIHIAHAACQACQSRDSTGEWGEGCGRQFQLQLQPQTRPQITDRVSRDPLDRALREKQMERGRLR